MATLLQVKIVTQEEEVLSAEAHQISLPGSEGDITVLPNHQALTSTMKAGEIDVLLANNDHRRIIVSPGFIQVANNVVTILVDSAVREEDLDEQKALAAKEAAEEAMKNMESSSEVAMTLGTIERTLMELRAIRRNPKHRAH